MVVEKNVRITERFFDNHYKQDFLDLTTINHDIGSFIRVVIPSTYPKFANFCDYIVVSKIL